MSKTIDALVAARGAFTYEQVAKACGLTADQVQRTERGPISTPTFWLLSLCHAYRLDFTEICTLIEADSRQITGLEWMATGPLQAESAEDFL